MTRYYIRYLIETRSNNMIAEDIDKYNNKNLFFMQPIKNTMINEGLFHKILYSNDIFTCNGLYIKMNFRETKWLNGRLIFNIEPNQDIMNRIVEIEKHILDKIDLNKRAHYKIYEQIKNGNFKTSNSNSTIIIKISGVWENQNTLGISYKIISINRTVN